MDRIYSPFVSVKRRNGVYDVCTGKSSSLEAYAEDHHLCHHPQCRGVGHIDGSDAVRRRDFIVGDDRQSLFGDLYRRVDRKTARLSAKFLVRELEHLRLRHRP